MKHVIAFVMLVLLSAPAMAEQTRQITVVGHGKASGVPNMATISLGVTEMRKTATEALNASSAKTAEILDRLRAAGLAQPDIQTSQISLNPQWNYRKSSGRDVAEITGFVASNILTVRIREMDRTGQVLDQVARGGANEFRGLSFGFAAPEAKQDEARVDAVEDAMRKARLMAGAAGLELGDVTSIEEQVSGGPRPVMMRADSLEAQSSVPVAPGEVAIQAVVKMVFDIED